MGAAAVNLAHIVDAHPADRPALISANQVVTYGELRDQVARARGGLVALGVGDGDRVAIVAGNGIPFVVAYLAAAGLGAVTVPLNPASPAPELHARAGRRRRLHRLARPRRRRRVARRRGAVGRARRRPSTRDAVDGATTWSELLAAEPDRRRASTSRRITSPC